MAPLITAAMTIPVPHQVHVEVEISGGSGSYDVRYYWGVVDHQALASPDDTSVGVGATDSRDHVYPAGIYDDFTSFNSTLEVAVQARDQATNELSNVVYFPIALPIPMASINPTTANAPADLTMTVAASAGTPWTGDPVHYNYFWTGATTTDVLTSPVDSHRFMDPVVNGTAYCRVDYESGYFVFALAPQHYTITNLPNLAGGDASLRQRFLPVGT